MQWEPRKEEEEPEADAPQADEEPTPDDTDKKPAKKKAAKKKAAAKKKPAPFIPKRITINGVEAKIKHGSRPGTFHIRETDDMFRDRCYHTLCADHERYFARFWVPRIEKDFEEYERELIQIVTHIEQCDRAQSFPKNRGACIGFGTCPYFSLCWEEDFDPDSERVPDGFYIAESAHEELDGEG